jgi:protein subunit release factor A
VPEEQEGADEPVTQCTVCLRNFTEESFKKHFMLCEKVFFRMRQEFSSVSQRISDPEHKEKLEAARQTISFYQNPKLNQKWKLESRKFRKTVKEHKDKVKLTVVPEAPEEDEGRVKCGFC